MFAGTDGLPAARLLEESLRRHGPAHQAAPVPWAEYIEEGILAH